MYCKYCGVQTPDGTDVCPMCQSNHPQGEDAKTENTNANPQNFYTQQQANTPPPQYNGYYGQPNPNTYNVPPNTQYPPFQMPIDYTPASFLLKLACFFFPIVGIILYIVDRDQKPVSAKNCLTAALIPLLIYIVFILILIISVFTGIAFSIF